MIENSYLRETLNRRARSLAHLRPLFDIETNKGRYPELPLTELDLFRFSSAVLDVIVTEMGGFHRGATYDQILSVLTPQIQQAVPEIDSLRVDRVTSFLLDQLTNERERDAFRVRYQTSTTDGRLDWAMAIFKLVELRDLEGDGQPRYVASAEAINIYLESLGIELEAQQAADEAALQHFIRHGKLDEAALATRTALTRTVEYTEHIRKALRVVERNVESVNWVADVLPKLGQARNHIEERIHAEDNLVAEAERKMSETDHAGRQKLVFVKEQLEVAARKHNELLTLVMSSNRIFLDEHARQSFHAIALTPFPNPQNAVLKPVLQRPIGETDEWLLANWHLLHPPAIEPLPDLSQLVAKLLQDRRSLELVQPILLPELENIEDPVPAFTADTRVRVEAALESLPLETRLSEWMAKIDTNDVDGRHLALLLTGQWYEEMEEGITISDDGQELQPNDVYGDDLLIKRKSHA
jgi:hypothetical protein